MKSESVSYKMEESTLDLRYWSTIRFEDSPVSPNIFFLPSIHIKKQTLTQQLQRAKLFEVLDI